MRVVLGVGLVVFGEIGRTAAATAPCEIGRAATSPATTTRESSWTGASARPRTA
jgi:hypothetical protein